jgi:hypothetical protein
VSPEGANLGFGVGKYFEGVVGAAIWDSRAAAGNPARLTASVDASWVK